MTKSLLSWAVLIALCSVAASARARPFRVNDIPNGGKNTCLNCHIDTKASAQTDFGGDAQLFLLGTGTTALKHVDWAPLCPRDSDRDGWTNGYELGDPDCLWTAGDPNPPGSIYNPGNPDSHPPPVCGSDKLEGGEDCDGPLMSKTECAEEGAGEGLLGCTDQCVFDYSQCSLPPGSDASSGGGDMLSEGGCSIAGTGRCHGFAGALAPWLGLALMGSRMRRRRPTRSR